MPRTPLLPRPTEGAAPATALRLPARQRRELARWAAAGYPYEACGVLVGRHDDGLVEVLHATRAGNLDRDRPETRYRLDPEDFLAADLEARAAGLDVVGFWHTHPDHPAEPSPTDLAAAWADYSYLIIATTAAGAATMRSWRLAGERFREETLEPEEPEP